MRDLPKALLNGLIGLTFLAILGIVMARERLK
jgi:amino acid transporter